MTKDELYCKAENSSKAMLGRLSPAYIEGYVAGYKESADIVCDLTIDMLNDGMIETRDIGAVNTRIRRELHL